MRGFTLVETLVALALLTLALLLGLGLVLQHPRIVHRLDAQREAIHLLETTLEALRAGGNLSDLPTVVGSRKMALSIQITPEGYPRGGLYHVQVRVTYKVEGQLRERAVETLVWRYSEP